MLTIHRSLQLEMLFAIVFVALNCTASYAQDNTQQAKQSLKPAAPKLDTSKPEPAPAPAAKPKSTLQGKVEHSRNATQPHNFLGLPGRASSGTENNIYRQNVQQRMLNSGITTGIGIIGVKFVLFAGRSPIVNRVFPLTPAAAVGIQPDDVIIAVDGIPTRGLRKEEVYDMIVGTPGTPVSVSIERDGDFKVYNLTRMNINELPDPAIRSDYLRSM
jgi:hypothetical protein